MGRIRTIKPEFPQSESMGRVSRDARLLFILLWTIADDHGRARANPRMLASLLYPYDNDAKDLVPSWLRELESVAVIRQYAVDGDNYLDIPKWLKHQKIDKPSGPKFPSFDEGSTNPREDSCGDQGRDPTKEGTGSLTAAAPPPRKRAPKIIPEWFLRFRAAYPERDGDQRWATALGYGNALIAAGHQPGELVAAAERYAAYIAASGEGGTRYVKQAASFLGKDKPFLLPWNPPPRQETALERIHRLNNTTGRTHEHEPQQDVPALVAPRGDVRR